MIVEVGFEEHVAAHRTRSRLTSSCEYVVGINASTVSAVDYAVGQCLGRRIRASTRELAAIAKKAICTAAAARLHASSATAQGSVVTAVDAAARARAATRCQRASQSAVDGSGAPTSMTWLTQSKRLRGAWDGELAQVDGINKKIAGVSLAAQVNTRICMS